MIPTGRLWGALCLLALPAMVAGFVSGLWPWVLLLDGLLVALAVADALLARAAKVEVTRALEPKLSVGVANKGTLTLVHRSPRAHWVKLRDNPPEGFALEPEEHALLLAPRSRVERPFRVTPSKRGKFTFGALALRVRGPLGLVWHERAIPAEATVAVYPDLRGANRLLLEGAAVDWVNLGLRQLRRDGRGSEFARLRDYAQGDSVREVDWKATARRGRPVTRVMESEKAQSVLICVDAGRTMAAKVEGLTKLDHAVNAALFLAFVAVKNGDRVGLAVFSDGVKAYLPPAAGRAQYRRIVDALYSTTPQLTFVDYLSLFKELSLRLPRRTLLCLFTDHLDEEQAGTLVEPLRKLSRRHVPLCLSVQDTALAELLATEPAEPEVAFQQAVATELLQERERVKGKLAREGVAVADVHPEQLSLEAVNRYLEIKSRGLL